MVLCKKQDKKSVRTRGAESSQNKGREKNGVESKGVYWGGEEELGSGKKLKLKLGKSTGPEEPEPEPAGRTSVILIYSYSCFILLILDYYSYS